MKGSTEESDLTSLFVLPEYQGKGVGKGGKSERMQHHKSQFACINTQRQ